MPPTKVLDDSDKLANMRLALRGAAGQILSTQADISTYAKLVDRITMRFVTDDQGALFKAQLHALKCCPNETLQVLYQDISRLAALAYPGPESTHSDALAVDGFIDAIDDEKLSCASATVNRAPLMMPSKPQLHWRSIKRLPLAEARAIVTYPHPAYARNASAPKPMTTLRHATH